MARADKPDRTAVNGVLVVDKPAGRTSFGVVADVRRRARGTRTGHAGTLDPLATGVLVVALGRATKIIDRIVGTEKVYLTRIDLGAFTATDDTEADREEVQVETPPRLEDVLAALEAFRGEFEQRPPAFSAIKIQGRRAYQMARRGETPDLPLRRVTIHELDLLEYAWPIVELSIRCAKGLYVRSLARDLGRALGTGGHCLSIRRTAVGPFTIDAATPLAEVPDPLAETDLISIDAALAAVGAA